jgi:hypothetical protein
MLSIGLIHGDLSEFTVLVAADGPVIIDLPQVMNAAGNNGAFAMLERDVNKLRGTLGRFAPELLKTEYAREIWALYEAGHIKPESDLTGVFAREESATDTAAVVDAIEDAREENIRRGARKDWLVDRADEKARGRQSRPRWFAPCVAKCQPFTGSVPEAVRMMRLELPASPTVPRLIHVATVIAVSSGRTFVTRGGVHHHLSVVPSDPGSPWPTCGEAGIHHKGWQAHG